MWDEDEREERVEEVMVVDASVTRTLGLERVGCMRCMRGGGTRGCRLSSRSYSVYKEWKKGEREQRVVPSVVPSCFVFRFSSGATRDPLASSNRVSCTRTTLHSTSIASPPPDTLQQQPQPRLCSLFCFYSLLTSPPLTRELTRRRKDRATEHSQCYHPPSR